MSERVQGRAQVSTGPLESQVPLPPPGSGQSVSREHECVQYPVDPLVKRHACDAEGQSPRS